MKKSPVLLLIFLAFSIEASATELTLDDCVTMAKERNGRLKAAAMDTAVTGHEEEIAFTRRLPSIKVDGQYTAIDREYTFAIKRNAFGPGVPATEVDISAGDRDFYSLGVHVDHPLYTGGNLTHAWEKAKIRREGSFYAEARQERLLVFEVKRAFFEALRDELTVDTIEKVVAARSERLRAAKEKLKEGFAKIEDILRLETDLSAVELDLFRARQRSELAMRRVKRLIYYEDPSELVLKGAPTNLLLSSPLQDLTTSALNNREDLKESQARVKAAGEDIEIAKSDYYPEISLRGSYFRQEETELAKPELWMFGARLDWTIFDWNRTRSEVNKAKAARDRLRYAHEELQKEVILEVEEAWTSIMELERVVAFREELCRSSEYYVAQTMNKYAEGTVLLADLLEQEAQLVKAYKDYLAAINDLDIAHAYLEATTSIVSPDWITPKELYRLDLKDISDKVAEARTARKPESFPSAPKSRAKGKP
ncbi:MAG: TolC family protein [Nitrospirota bacterium]|nr:TolC family protein [Nitrospirota bacterium]